VGGAQLSDLLGALAEAAARQAATSREFAARQGPHRLAATLIAAVAVGVLLYVRWKSPAYMAAYGTPEGQAWMGLGFGLITAGYWALLRLGRLPGGGT
jgi:Flp pilus assembly protein TadB